MQRLTKLIARAVFSSCLFSACLATGPGQAMAQPAPGGPSARYEDGGRHVLQQGQAPDAYAQWRMAHPIIGPHHRPRHDPTQARGHHYRPLPHVSPRLRRPQGRPECELGLHGCEGRDGTRHGVY